MNRVISGFVVMGLLTLTMAGESSGEEKMIQNGSKVSFDYTLMVDGKVMDTSEGKAPLEYTQGGGNIIPGLEKQMEGLKEGDERSITVPAEEAYGARDESFIKELDKAGFGEGSVFDPGQGVTVQTPDGRSFSGIIGEVKESSVMVDFNHPLAGKELHFDVKVVSIS